LIGDGKTGPKDIHFFTKKQWPQLPLGGTSESHLIGPSQGLEGTKMRDLQTAAAADEGLLDTDDSRDELLDLLGSFDVADIRLPSTSSSPASPVHTCTHQWHHQIIQGYK